MGLDFRPKLLIIDDMLGLFTLTISLMLKPIVIDSALFKPDITTSVLDRFGLNETIIDNVADDNIYLLTRHYLYKFDPNNYCVSDRIPLPQRFNYLFLDKENIILLTTDEIIVIDKNTLSFVNGVGIEYGDYQPIASFQKSVGSVMKHFILIIQNTEKKSYLKLIDLKNGRLIKKVVTNRIVTWIFDSGDSTLTTLDKNKMAVYNLDLKRRALINLHFPARSFVKGNHKYLVEAGQGIFSYDQDGTIIDFQPMMNGSERKTDFLFLSSDYLCALDTMTMRVRNLVPNEAKISSLYQTGESDFFVASDRRNVFYFVDATSLRPEPVMIKEVAYKEARAETVREDSSWYFQFGAFAAFSNAQDMYDVILSRGLPVFIDSTDLYRVKLGGFSDKSAAHAIIESTGLPGWFVFQKKVAREDHREFLVGSQRYVYHEGLIQEEQRNEKNN